MARSSTTPWMVAAALTTGACGERLPTLGEGGATSTAAHAAEDGEDARIHDERRTLDACRLGRPCGALRGEPGPPDPSSELSCMWRVLTLDVGAEGRFVDATAADPSTTTTVEELLYVEDGAAYLSRRAGPLRRCSIRSPLFFQQCLDAHEAGAAPDADCWSFEGWLEGCVNAGPACP